MLEAVFEKHNFKTLTAINGHIAYQEVFALKHSDSPKELDLVVLDLNMPVSNGYEACQKIRKLYRNNATNN